MPAIIAALLFATRRATRVPKVQKQRRLENKKKRAETKKLRGRVE